MSEVKFKYTGSLAYVLFEDFKNCGDLYIDTNSSWVPSAYINGFPDPMSYYRIPMRFLPILHAHTIGKD